MVTIRSIGGIVSSLTKIEKTTLAQNDKAIYDFFKKMTSGYTKGHRKNDLPRIYFEGSNYEELPSFVRSLIDNLNLKRPNVIVRGRSLNPGQGILGFKISDGNKIVGTTSYGLDLTRGEPIHQLRFNFGNGTESAISFNSILDTNLVGKSSLQFDTFINKKVAKQIGLTDEMIAGISSVNSASTKEISYLTQYLRELFANKGNMVHSIDECIDELVQIASQKGKVTKQSATEAVERILVKMGYNPKDVKLTFLGKEAEKGGAFGLTTGELELNINMIKNHQDLADILGHELTHMEDFLLYYKLKGAENLRENLRKFLGDDFNKSWYDKMSRYISKNQGFAFESNGIPTEIITSEGKRLTKPKEIKEFLSMHPQARRFDVSAIEKDLKREAKTHKSSLQGSYARLKEIYEYTNMATENHARKTELVFSDMIKQKGIYRKTSLSRDYGQTPGKHSREYSLMFEQIEKTLSKQGTKKCQKFNELYHQSLYTIDSELAVLYKQLEELPDGKARMAVVEKAEQIIKNRHQDFEYLDLKIMHRMQQKLGLIPTLMPEEACFQAMQRLNPEIAEIHKAMREGRPKKEFEKLVKKRKELVTKYYGNEVEFGVKIAAEEEKIQREIAERNLKPFIEQTNKAVTEAIETKQSLIQAYDDLIDYAKTYGTKEGFERIG